MLNSTLARMADARLQRAATSLEAFLRAGVDRGDSAETLSRDLRDLTDIEVDRRTIYRWIDRFGIERSDLRFKGLVS